MDILNSNISLPRRARRQAGWLIAGILISLTLFPSIAHADSGGATISKLPDSSQVEGHVEVSHECGGIFKAEREQPCPWFAEATQYPANVECPAVYDGSHGVWIGPLEHGSATSSGSFSFVPEATVVRLCLYVNEEGSDLVGASHAFDTQTARRHPTNATLKVQIYNGCKAHIYADARGGGEDEHGGSWSDTELWGPAKAKFLPVSSIQPWIAAVEGPPGSYRLRMHFDGNASLLPSPPAIVTFRLRRCTK
jgi:hypothetical protein